MFDTAGSRFDFTVAAGVEETFRLSFWAGAEGVDVAGAAFEAACYVAHGEERGELAAVFGAQHDARANAVLLTAPGLAEGHYLWELRATDAAGKECRLLYGALSALGCAEVGRLVAGAEGCALRELSVQVGGGFAAPLVLRWQASSVAAAAADAAAGHAGAAVAAAEAAAGHAAKAAVAAAAAEEDARLAHDVYGLWEARVERVVWCNPATGTWWVYGVDTHAAYRGEDGRCPRIGAGGTWLVWDADAGVWADSGVQARGRDGRSPYINALGNWVRWDDAAGAWVDEGVRAFGRDGRDGAAVRRIVVDAESEIPQSGEMCNGGVYYYVRPRAAVAASGWVLLVNAPAGSDAIVWLYVNGVAIDSVRENSQGADVWAAAVNAANCGVRATAGRRDGQPILCLEAIESGAAGNAISVSTSGAEPCSGPTLAGGADAGEGYRVFAWLEDRGVGGWVCVGEANDLATAEVYGLVRLGTDVPVAGGAPVGVDADGGMCVPRAGYTLPGAVLPGANGVVAGGAGVGFDAEGRMRVQEGDCERFGVARMSFAGVAEAPCIGRMADGRLGLPWATLAVPGAVKLGSMFDEHARIPYRVGVGATAGHELANNLLVGGALQHQQPAAWAAMGMGWLDGAGLQASAYYLGLATSESFMQSELNGLELREATGALLGGVRLAETVSASGAGVVTAGLLYGYLRERYYTRDEVWRKGETYSKAEVDAIDAGNRQDAAGKYKTMAAAGREHDELSGRIDGCVKKTESWNGEVYLTLSEYQALKVRDPKIAYNILED